MKVLDENRITYSSRKNSTDEDLSPLRCWDCNINFTSREYLYTHLLHHIKQPSVIIEPIQFPAIKVTLKNNHGNFEVINSPLASPQSSSNLNLADNKDNEFEQETAIESETNEDEEVEDSSDYYVEPEHENIGEENSSNLVELEKNASVLNSKSLEDTDNNIGTDYSNIPGGEPTPPPDSSPDLPKIRIKSSGLLKNSRKITEIPEENHEDDPKLGVVKIEEVSNAKVSKSALKQNADNILSIFNNNERAKDLGFCTSDSEFISMDRLEDRSYGSKPMYNHSGPSSSRNSLDAISGLPMHALAQQVSRLQHPSNGMHQQNVLINIQQFPTTPHQAPYPPTAMYQHQPHPSQPMFSPYQYQPPNHLYYPPAPPPYPTQHVQPPHQMGPPGPHPPYQQPMRLPGSTPIGQPPRSNHNINHLAHSQSSTYHNLGPRQNTPRQTGPGQKIVSGPRGSLNPRQSMMRQRVPIVRPRMPLMRPSMRLRASLPQQTSHRMVHSLKRTPTEVNDDDVKRKKFDVLTPDKDDEDCQVICMQPKNTDGILPQIESIQGGTSEPTDNNIMHLSDSITLSVRNPQTKSPTPKNSDAKTVANILATRGITVTPTAKPKEKDLIQIASNASAPQSINLNGAVSILPSEKRSPPSKNAESLPTVDLTDDVPQSSQENRKLKGPPRRTQLPYRCDLCTAQYPNSLGLVKHRRVFHKTTGGICELGIPLVNMKEPGIIQRLSNLGIFNYIPLPSSADGMFGLPVLSTRNPGNIQALNATSMLSLGPVRSIPRHTPPAVNKSVKQKK